jgi:hypothetical protein
MTKITPRSGGAQAVRKKSVSKASAAKGREDSCAGRIKQQEDAFSKDAHKRPEKLAKLYAARGHDEDQERKVHHNQKKKSRNNGKSSLSPMSEMNTRYLLPAVVSFSFLASGCDTTARSSRTGVPDINAEPAAVGGRAEAGARGTTTERGGKTGTVPGTTVGGVSSSGAGSGPPSPATTGSPSSP